MTTRRLPTMRDIADHLGVSRQLVSLVLRGAPGPSVESRDRVLAAATELGYHVHSSARQLRQNRTFLLGLVFHLHSAFESRVAERLVERASSLGYGAVLGPISPGRPTATVVSELLGQRVEAIVSFVAADGPHDVDAAVGLVPVAVLGAAVDDPRVDNIHVDDVTGLRLAVEHLAALGHSRIAYLDGGDSLPAVGRRASYRAAMTGAGLADRADVVGSGFGEDAGAEAARELLARPELPTAIVCAGDQAAAGVLAVFARAGVRVPDDVSVIGFDDSDIARLSYHSLTSVRQDPDATAEAALAAVLERVTDADAPPREVLTPARLVVRTSTGPVRPGA